MSQTRSFTRTSASGRSRPDREQESGLFVCPQNWPALPPPDSRCAPRLPSWRAIRSRSNRRPEKLAARPSLAWDGTGRCRVAGEYVACTSLITVDFRSFASRASGKNSCTSFTRHLDDLRLRFLNQAARAAHDQLDIAAAVLPRFVAARFNQPRFVEHPLDGAVKQHGVIEIADLTIKPEMDAGDRRSRELAERRRQRRSRRIIRQHASQHIKRNGQNQIVEFLFLSVRRNTYRRKFPREMTSTPRETGSLLHGREYSLRPCCIDR